MVMVVGGDWLWTVCVDNWGVNCAVSWRRELGICIVASNRETSRETREIEWNGYLSI